MKKYDKLNYLHDDQDFMMARDAIKEIMELKSRNELADSHQFYLRLYSLQELLKNNSNKGRLSEEVFKYIPIVSSK